MTNSPSSAPLASPSPTRYSVRLRRSVGVTAPSRKPRRKTPTMRALAGLSIRITSASVSPVSRATSRAAARAPIGNGSISPVSASRDVGAGPGPGQETGRTSGTPSSSLPKRSTTTASGSCGAEVRRPLRSPVPERLIEGNLLWLRPTEVFRPLFAIYPGGALDQDRDPRMPAFFVAPAAPRARGPACFAPLCGLAFLAFTDLRGRPLPFARCAASSGTACSSENRSGSAAFGSEAITPSWLR